MGGGGAAGNEHCGKDRQQASVNCRMIPAAGNLAESLTRLGWDTHWTKTKISYMSCVPKHDISSHFLHISGRG